MSMPLGDDRERKFLHDKLVDSIRALPCPPASDEWRFSPGEARPTTVHLAVGDAIKLADSLKIMVQYARIMGQACHSPDTQVGRFLAGHPDTCAPGLAWFAKLLEPMQDVSHLEKEYARYLDLWAQGPKEQSDEHLAFEVHQGIPCTDTDFTRYLLSLSFPGAKEYEVLVAQNIMRLSPDATVDEFKQAFKEWRSSGLLHCLLIGARHMPTLNDWLPVDLHQGAELWSETLMGVNTARSHDDLRAAMAHVGIAFGESSEAGTQVAAVLDRLGVFMRVKSNGAEASLDEALGGWTLDASAKPHEIWARAKGQLEASVPPSLLCPRLFGAKRGSWGYRGLSLEWDPAGRGRLSIAQRELDWIPKPDASTPVPLAAKLGQWGARVQDVVSRLGEISLSPEMGHLMMFAADGKEYLETGLDTIKEHERMTCEDPRTLMAFMDEADRYMSPVQHIEAFQRELEVGLPQVRTVALAAPMQLVCWRLDPPGRIVLFTGRADEAMGKPPCDLKKRLLDERSSAKAVARIRLAPGDPHDEVTKGILYYVHRHFKPIQEAVKKDAKAHTHTTMVEALACFTSQRPVLHTKVEMHSSVRWDNQYCDYRYAETQSACNGVRYRDWTTVFAEGDVTQKVRLDSHVVRVSELHQTQFPWRRADGRLQWVNVAASVPPNLLVLHERLLENKDDFRGLLASVKSRVLQDLKLLPVRDEGHRVERANTSVYGDATTGQVLVAYAPTGDPEKRIEFMAFEMARPV